MPRLAVVFALAGVMVAALAGWIGYSYGIGRITSVADSMTADLHAKLDEQRTIVADAGQELRANLDAMALRAGRLQAEVVRLSALGSRLVELGELDPAEFDFSEAPPMGGIEAAARAVDDYSSDDLMKQLDRLGEQVDARGLQLRGLENLIMGQHLRAEVLPSGRPVKSGWVSSAYGKRTDPFTGKKDWHSGIDFAGKEGSDVVTVATGVVQAVEQINDYGLQVLINHGDGYVTRYGHNSEVLVAVGQTVHKGETIARMGSSGRSTGPHVHFEVLKDGRAVNPSKFVRSAG